MNIYPERKYRFLVLIVFMLIAILPLIGRAGAAEDYASLSAAIAAANSGDSRSITLSADITLNTALPPIRGKITIDGDGHKIDGDEQFRIFDVDGGVLTIKNLTLAEGKAPREESGGAIRMRSSASVTISDSSFSKNSADIGGVISLEYGSLEISSSSFTGNAAVLEGGVIYTFEGTIAIINSSFVDNNAEAWGGVIYTERSGIGISNSTFDNNRASHGGVLLAYNSEVTMTHLTMMNNSAEIDGDAISRSDGTINLRNSIVAGSGRAEDCLGGLDQNIGNLSRDGTCGIGASDDPRLDILDGAPGWHLIKDGSPAVDAADAGYCLETDQIGTPRPQGGACDIGAIESMTAVPALPTPVPPLVCTLSDQIIAANTDRQAGACPAGSGADTIVLRKDITLLSALPNISSYITVEGNGFTISGAGEYRIFNVDKGKLTISNLTLKQGKASPDTGGAIKIHGNGAAVVNNSRFVNNSAKDGGAIWTHAARTLLIVNNSAFIDNRASSAGGAIMMTGGGAAVVTNSVFVNNAAGGGVGGAIDVTNANNADISNSTFVGNRAQRGGALAAGYGRATVSHVTMFKNDAIFGEGISIYRPFAGASPRAFRLRNSVIISSGRTASDCYGVLTQNVGNFIADGTCSPPLSGDPLLEDMTGSQTYVAMQAGSPLIDAASAEFCLETDQIGTPRPLGGGCDIGAIEAWPQIQVLSECSVTTTHGLNFRDGPKGNRIGNVPRNVTLTATARTPGWFNVEHDGVPGWISAGYVVTEGDCE